MKKFCFVFLMWIIFIMVVPIFVVLVSNISNSKISKINEDDNIINNKDEEVWINLYLSSEDRVIKLSLEDYVVGVVSAEMPAEFNEEALKAQAVASRTYALTHVTIFGGKMYNEEIGADLIDTQANQAYLSKEERYESWAEDKRAFYWNKIVEAVNETKGEIIAYDGKLIEAPYYFSTSSGETENSQDVFSCSEPYLVSVESKGEEIAPKYESDKFILKTSFVNTINNAYKDASLDVDSLEDNINIESRTEAGSVKEIKIGKITLEGTKFRSLLGLNSANFSISFNNDEIKISCKGYGHGVGMSQWGARVMGNSGSGYEEILKHYYHNTEIVPYYELKKS
ncbi:MAG: stage II sporulation protein D [Clostridiaceae bacterium]